MFSANKMLNVGIPRIDADHKALDEIARKIEKAVVSSLPMHEIRSLVTQLQSTAQSHFDREEIIFAPYDLPRMAQHEIAHKEIIHNLSVLLKTMEENSNWKNQLFSILGDMTQHVIFYDMEIKDKPIPALSENSIFKVIRQEKIKNALQLWKLSREREGICDLSVCEGQENEMICCAYHLQGRMLSLSLANHGDDYLQLSRKIGKWIDTHDPVGVKTGNSTTKSLRIPSSLIIGHPTIDYDHRQLVDIINYISLALENKEYEKCSELTNRFIGLAKGHFKREEQILKETGFPERISHKDTHDKLLSRMSQFVEISRQLEENELARARLYPELVAFLFDDAVKADLAFKSYMMKLDIFYD